MPSKTTAKLVTKRSKMRLIATPNEMARIVATKTSTAPNTVSGYVDYYGFSPGLAGWFIGGWAQTGAFASGGTCSIEAMVGDEQQAFEACFITFLRADVAEHGLGFVIFVPGTRTEISLSSLAVRDGASRFALRLSDEARAVDERDLLREVRSCGRRAINDGRTGFLAVIGRPVFDGSDTIAALAPTVQLGIDEVISASGCGIVTVGWLVDPLSQVELLRIRRDDAAVTLADRWTRFDRPDLLQALGSSLGLTHSRWGFVAFAPLTAESCCGAYLEIVLRDGTVGHRALPAAGREGLPAIKTILNNVVLSPDSIMETCRDVLAEPVRAINRRRMTDGVSVLEASAGISPACPRTSIVIPLYGRLDFLTCQAALFDAVEHANDEFIYVLDQPERKDEFFELARIAHIKTRIPFRLLVPSRNLGFAGASNLGLRRARGKYVCFLNSDVVPKSKNWMSGLVASLESRPDIGVVSALMLFEDETIQHAGLDFERLPQFGNMRFPFHPGKGRIRERQRGLDTVAAVTGACTLMDRGLCLQLGGFDEDYVIGDFEDADLCMRVRARGLACAVDDRVVLYHLERQSQSKPAEGWRMNLTLVNAWTFAERWDPDLLQRPDAILKIA